ncbi:hypothetical protein NDU88_003071 [Pleurodeles waltl]|uniref:Uncharacterized protein n=1 Tax=Pleurodeles waltl TaxID=8319 RepID=A0AAV7L548_PLEWA|nr:hypothetical protein NDU88_003071 [Pleurodeles waltl]
MAGAHTRRSGLHPPPLRVGPRPTPVLGAARCPILGRGRNLAAISWVRSERVHRRPPPGSRPRSSGRARISHSPSLLLRIGEPLGPARLGPARRQGRGLSAVPGSPSHSGVRSRGETATPQSPPSAAVVSLFSECKTARLSASRHQFKVGPSGADQLSVRHARLRGHAPKTESTFVFDGSFKTSSSTMDDLSTKVVTKRIFRNERADPMDQVTWRSK